MNKLWYNKPAKWWRQALPLGNGITGIMIYGGKRRETLAFNNCNLWSGYPKDQDNEESLKHLGEVRRLVFEGKNSEADKLAESKLIGGYSEAFMPLGELVIKFSGVNGGEYKRELDLSTALHKVNFGDIERETFVSYPNKVAVYNISSKNKISVGISAKSKMKSQVAVDDGINLTGNAPDFVAPNYLRLERKPIKYTDGLGMSFCLRAEVVSDGKISYKGNKITICDATKITVYMTTATGYIDSFSMPDIDANLPYKKCKEILSSCIKDYTAIKSAHIIDYKKIYEKNIFSLGEELGNSTDELLAMAKAKKPTKALVELFYNYGKYLTIAGSRQGGQALNLQGLWNNSMRPPWSSNYTANINAEMNYWGASNSNLTECFEPYINLVYEIMQRGKKTAKVNYGCDGFACNHNVDIWRKTAPVKGNSNYMFAPMCGVWLANELYEHYKNGKLEIYKDKIFEIVSEATKFTNDYLVMHDGHYVTAPSASPENSFVGDDNKKNALDYASAYELGLTRQIFDNYLQIGEDNNLREQISEKMSKIYPFTAGDTGINEWHKNYFAPEKGHRHFSPLYGFYPARVIKYYKNEKERELVKQLFDYRLDNCNWFIGWSAAWAICLSGRLHDATAAKKIVDDMLAKSVFENLFNIHPPHLFQIDGNFGFVGGINEMMVYSENGIVELLPALPKEWATGQIKGFVVGGVEISFKWQNGTVIQIESDKPIKIFAKNIAKSCSLGQNVELVNKIFN